MTPQDLQRIEELEYKFNEVSRVLASLDMAFDEYTDIKDWIGELKEYMESGQWKKDYEADERGEIPSNIARGVLSEDGLYDLLADSDRILKRITDTSISSGDLD